MEITAEDCSWRVKEKSQWRKAQAELLSAEDGTTSLQVKKLHEKLGETKMLRSAILLQMESGSHMKKIAKLVVHCRLQNHLDFKMTMFQKSDMDHVGGELGVAPDANHSYHFLFSKQGMMQMRADQEFKARLTILGETRQTMTNPKPKELAFFSPDSCGRSYTTTYTLNASIQLSSALLKGS